MPLPLLRLPESVLRLTVSSMEFLDMLTIGLCSEKSRKLVASLEFESLYSSMNFGETPSFNIVFRNNIELIMHLNSTRSVRYAGFITEIQVDSVDVEYGTTDERVFLHEDPITNTTWTRPEWSFQDWAKFIIEIFGKFEAICFDTNSGIYHLPSLELQLQGLHENLVLVQEECPKWYHLLVYHIFQPLNGSCIRTNPYPDFVSFQRLIYQNFRYLEFSADCPVALEELSMTNSKTLELNNCTSITAEDINRFIKLWQKGSNGAMIFMAIRIPVGEVWEIEKVLKGTKYQVAPQERELEMRNEKYVKYTVTGGYDVRGKNGRVATVKIVLNNRRDCLEFHVWP